MKNNYVLQAHQATARFLEYDQQALIEKCALTADEGYLYLNVLGQKHRISRSTGRMERLQKAQWIPAQSHEEVMTVLDLLCDSRPDRSLCGRWKGMSSFGMQFHQNLLEDQRDPDAEAIEADPALFCRACEALGGRKLPGGDLGYAVEMFDGLEIGMQFWFGDEEFAPRLRYLWDENALQYLRYETMFYAVSVLKHRLEEKKNELRP